MIRKEMQPGWRYRLLVCCAVMLLVACARPEQGGTPDLVSATPPGKTPGPTQTAVPTRTPEPTSTPTRRPTVTPEPVHLLPGGWQHFGDERFGLQAGAPEHWIDASATFRGADAFRRFAPRLLLLADTEETATSLLSGVPFGSGAFVFGFLAESLAPDSDPVDTVTDQLASVGALDGQSIEVTTITLNDVPAAYMDLAGDPFGVFPAGEQTIQYRLLSLSKPETAANGLFLLATDTSDGESPQELFDMIMNSINLPDSNMNIHDQIISGDLVSSVLQQDTTDIWTFFGEAGRHASITVTPDESDIDLTLALIDPSGEILASIDNGYGGDVETLTDVPLPESGIYIIEAGEFFNAAGSYALNIYLTDFPAFGGGGRIEFGMEVSSELAANAEHEWVFHGVAAQDVTIILSALNEQLDVIVEMRGPYGQELIILDEGFAGDAEIITGFELPLTGEYRIKVRGFAEHGGMYSLTLDEGGESTVNFHDAGDLANGERRREFLQENEAHAWFFYGEAGDMVTITVTPLEPELDLDIWLLDANLSELVMQDDFSSGVSEKIEHELVTAGQYLILVREFFGEIGEYEILLKVERGPVSELTEGSRQ